LLAHGADVNARQGGGFTALHAAAASSDAELARLLLAAGADATARADDGREPDLGGLGET
jgi:ankyrin repeat protein